MKLYSIIQLIDNVYDEVLDLTFLEGDRGIIVGLNKTHVKVKFQYDIHNTYWIPKNAVKCIDNEY